MYYFYCMPYVAHTGRLRAADVVELVSVDAWTLDEAGDGGLAHVVAADKRVLAVAKRRSKRSCGFDAVEFVLEPFF